MGNPAEYWDAHYQSLYADASGRLHMIFNPHQWPNALVPAIFRRDAVLYIYSDDHGVTWKNATGTTASTPFAANDYSQATLISSSEEGVYTASILATKDDVHILYWDNAVGLKHVRLDRDSGNREADNLIPNVNVHSVLVAHARRSSRLYIVTETNNLRSPTLFVTQDSGDTWDLHSQILVPPTKDIYFSTTALQEVTDGATLALTTDFGYAGGPQIVNFVKYSVGGAPAH